MTEIAVVFFRISVRELRGDGGHLGFGLVGRDAGRQTADDVEPAKAAALAESAGWMQRHPERRGIALSKFEIMRKDADDGDGLAVEANRGADDVRPSAEFGAPEGVAEDDDVRPIGLVFAVDEIAAERGLDAECGEEIRSDARGQGELRFAARVEDEAVASRMLARDWKVFDARCQSRKSG